MDDLLKALGRAARDDRSRALDDDEAVAAKPLDEAAREALVDAALSALALPREAPAAGPPSAPAAPAPPAAPRGVVARLTRRHFGATAALAIAASIAFFLVFRPEGPAGDDLPAYRLSLSGSVSELRGEPAAPSATAKARADSTLTLVVRPEAPVTRPLEARAFVERDGALRRLDAPLEVSPEGAVRLVARADRLFRPPLGTHRLIVAVGPRGALPDTTSLDALRRAPGVRVSEALVSVEGP